MSLWAIVPVKPLRRGKSRLAEVLNETQRMELNKQMLIQTVEKLNQVKDIEHVLVVSRDPEALAAAREVGAKTLREDGSPELNIALTRAAVLANAYNVHGVIVVPADLPLLDPEDVAQIAALGRQPPVVVIAPDRHCEGTNILLLSPPGIIAFDYGSGSFARHCERARVAGADLKVCNLPALALDVDWPADLEHLSEKIKLEIGVEPVLEKEWGEA